MFHVAQVQNEFMATRMSAALNLLEAGLKVWAEEGELSAKEHIYSKLKGGVEVNLAFVSDYWQLVQFHRLFLLSGLTEIPSFMLE